MAIALPSDDRKYTDATALFVDEINDRFPDVGTFGIYNRRRIADSTSWSQHSWGNAVDITSPPWMLKPPLYSSASEASQAKYADHMAYLDAVRRWITDVAGHVLPRYVAWRRYMHYNHIHIDFHPKQTGIPPVLTPIQEDEDIMKTGDKGLRVVAVQLELIAKGQALPQYGADGDFGSETLAAVRAWQTDEGLEADGELQAVDMAILFTQEAPALEFETVRVLKGVK